MQLHWKLASYQNLEELFPYMRWNLKKIFFTLIFTVCYFWFHEYPIEIVFPHWKFMTREALINDIKEVRSHNSEEKNQGTEKKNPAHKISVQTAHEI